MKNITNGNDWKKKCWTSAIIVIKDDYGTRRTQHTIAMPFCYIMLVIIGTRENMKGMNRADIEHMSHLAEGWKYN